VEKQVEDFFAADWGADEQPERQEQHSHRREMDERDEYVRQLRERLKKTEE
jgi:hypothetical protein